MNFKISTFNKRNEAMTPSIQRVGLLFLAVKALNSQAQCSSTVLQIHHVQHLSRFLHIGPMGFEQ